LSCGLKPHAVKFSPPPFQAEPIHSVPLIIGIQSLFWTFVPLLSVKLGIGTTSRNIYLLAIFSLPGLLLGYFFGKFSRKIDTDVFISCTPFVVVGVSCLFLIYPSEASYILLVVIWGLVRGLYWPSDTLARSRIPTDDLVQFNAKMLQRFSLAQLVACCVSLIVFSYEDFRYNLLSSILIFTIISLLTLGNIRKASQLVFAGSALVLLCFHLKFSLTGGHKKIVVLPSISHNLKIRKELTYAEMIVLNDTSGRLFRLDKDLTIAGDLAKSFSRTDDFKTYTIELDPLYRSARGEGITSDDVLFSIKYLLNSHSGLVNSLGMIEGAQQCQKNKNCSLEGFEVLNKHSFRLHLTSPHANILAELVSPQFVILKSDRPQTESVGDCEITYQTGKSMLTSCTKNHIEVMSSQGVKLEVVDNLNKKNETKNTSTSVLTSVRKTGAKYPSLSTLAFFGNPDSSLSKEDRISTSRLILASFSKELASFLKLEPVSFLTPNWLRKATNENKKIDEISVEEKNVVVTCPARPISLVLEASIPEPAMVSNWLASKSPCPITSSVVDGANYFESFKKSDFALAWFTPSFLSSYDLLSVYDCSTGAICYMNWKDPQLQGSMDNLRNNFYSNSESFENIMAAEKRLHAQGYMVPVAEMNWWIERDEAQKPIHPAGLFQVRLSDF
jgi:Bacterial extracellular solute-binding proteins, family 5 Middle